MGTGMGALTVLAMVSFGWVSAASTVAPPPPSPPTTQPSAELVITQDGLNNGPALYGEFLAEGLKAANTQMRAPGFFCSALGGQAGCSTSSCTCSEVNKALAVHLNVKGVVGAVQGGDFLKLANANDVNFTIHGPASGYVGALEVRTMVELGVSVPVDGSLFSGGFLGHCCHIFCSCRCGCDGGCDCNHVCNSPNIVATATTLVIANVQVKFDPTTHVVTAVMDGCPGGCLQMPNLAKDMKVNQGCLGTMISRARDNWMLKILSWLTGVDPGGIFDKMVAQALAAVLPAANTWLAQHVATVPQSCGTACGLPPGVTAAYSLVSAPLFVANEHIEVMAEVQVQATIGTKVVPFVAENALAPPMVAALPYTTPKGCTSLAGLRLSSSLLNGVAWALGKAGAFLSLSNLTFLDAKLAVDIQWSNKLKPPHMTVLDTNLLGFEWSDGHIKILCENNQADMMNIAWTALSGNGTLNASIATGTLCAFPQVRQFDLDHTNISMSAPKVPLPAVLVERMLKTAVNSGRSQLNAVMRHNEMCIPASLGQYFNPTPSAVLLKQNAPGQEGLGFVEFNSFCGPTGAAAVRCRITEDLTTVKTDVQTNPDMKRSIRATRSGPEEFETETCNAALQAEARCSENWMSNNTSSWNYSLAHQCGTTYKVLAACYGTDSRSRPDAAVKEVRDHPAWFYEQDGKYYSFGNITTFYNTTNHSGCSRSARSQHYVQQFKNGQCTSEGVLQRCVGDTFFELQYQNSNCTGQRLSVVNATASTCYPTDTPTGKIFTFVDCPTLLRREDPREKARIRLLFEKGFVVFVCAMCFAAALLWCSRISIGRTAAAGSIRCLSAVSKSLRDSFSRCTEAIRILAVKTGATISSGCSRGATFARSLTFGGFFYGSRVDFCGPALILASSAAIEVHREMWQREDPFAAFEKSIFSDVGLSSQYVDPSGVQSDFRRWSYWGQQVQWVVAGCLVGTVALICCVDLFSRQSRLNIWVTSLVFATLVQIAVFLAPPFMFPFTIEVLENKNFSISLDPDSRNSAQDSLTLLFDGVALTFVSSLYVFMLHAIPAGVFSGSLLFVLRINCTDQAELSALPRAPRARRTSWTGSRGLFDQLVPAPSPIIRATVQNQFYAKHEIDISEAETALKETLHSTFDAPAPSAQRLLNKNAALDSESATLSQDGVVARSVNLEHDSARKIHHSSVSSNDNPSSVGENHVRLTTGSITATADDTSPRHAALYQLYHSETIGEHTSSISREVLAQQNPRIRILNWMACVAAPLGGALPIIVIYQSEGANLRWLCLWIACWVGSGLALLPLQWTIRGWGGSRLRANTILLAVAVGYGSLYVGATTKILTDLSKYAREGVCRPPEAPCGFGHFAVSFPALTVLSMSTLLAALTFTYLESSMADDQLMQQMGVRLKRLSLPSIAATNTTNPSIATQNDSLSKRLSWALWDFVSEHRERADPVRYGRRLPSRRISLWIGVALSFWVVRGFADSHAHFRGEFVLNGVKQEMSTGSAGVTWPSNGTVFDEAFAQYGNAQRVEFALLVTGSSTLLGALLCDAIYRDQNGLYVSRMLGFAGLGILFASSLIAATPNYLQISHLDTICPYCSPRFNFAVQALSQDLVGITCSALFAFDLLPVLLVVMPSMVRACTLLLVDDMRQTNRQTRRLRKFSAPSPRTEAALNVALRNFYAPDIARQNVHGIVCICAVLTALCTAIPMTVLYQSLSNYGQGRFVATMLGLFYLVPFMLSIIKCNAVWKAEARYFLYLATYFGPLAAVLLHESSTFGYMAELKQQLETPLTYGEVFCEVLLANVILSDMMYASMYVQGSNPLATVATTAQTPRRIAGLVVIPGACIALGIIAALWQLGVVLQ